MTLQVGDRIRLTELGRQRSPRMTQTGVVTGAVGSGFDVLLDGARIPVRLHRSYIEKVAEESIRSAQGSDQA